MRTKKMLASCLVILALVVTVVAGAVFAAPMQQKQNTDGSIGYTPASGIRWNPGTKNFEVYNYAGFTQIGSGNFVSSTGEVTSTGADISTRRQATMSDKYSIMQDIAYEVSDAVVTSNTDPFKGVLDGRGMNLVDFPLRAYGSSYYGLFYENAGTIRNVNLITPSMDTITTIGGVGLFAYHNSGTISGSTTYGSASTVLSVNFGGFVYNALEGTLIEDSINNFEYEAINNNGSRAGFVGNMGINTKVVLKNCINNADYLATYAFGFAGRIVQNHGFEAYNCQNYGVMQSLTISEWANDFTYLNIGKIQNCYGMKTSGGQVAGTPYTLQYMVNGGTFGAMTANTFVDVYTGATTKLPTEGTKVGGYSFVGWYTTAKLELESRITTVNALQMRNGIVTVYAKFILGEADGNLAFKPINSDTEYEVSLAEDYAGTIVIPSTYKSKTDVTAKPVTALKAQGFDNSIMTGLEIPSSIKTVGMYAFKDCKSLASVKIEAGAALGSSMFTGCPSLQELVIPEGTTAIPAYFLTGSGVKSLTIPSSVVSVENAAFQSNALLETVIFSEGVQTIGNVFTACPRLTSVTLPSTLTEIKSIPGNAGLKINFSKENSKFVLRGESNILIEKLTATLRSYPITKDLVVSEEYGIEAIGDGLFASQRIETVVLPKGITKVGHEAFAYNGALKSITIPDEVTSIGRNAFMSCGGLTSIVLPKSLTAIPSATFWGCSSLTSIEIPDSVTSIGDNSFNQCSALTSVYIPLTVLTIESNSFGWAYTMFTTNATKRNAGWPTKMLDTKITYNVDRDGNQIVSA